ncbi:MAG TPA: ABC-F family ATP-binding cassette domain-containing protein [Bacteroidia bacterium]|nr:ABC-F family ATP-binding cassette domain-containing protein [Bacteroidia bacterium]
MLVLNNISFEFGSRYLYHETSWHIKPFEKIGLIGANGTGKSTLLRIINGEYQVSEGELTKRRDLSIGFLNQDLLSYESGNSILTVAMEAFEKQNQLSEEIDRLLHLLETDHSDDVLHKLHDAQTLFEALDGYQIKSRAEAVLEGLGFSTTDLTRPLNEFSGGWRMRVMLAKILLAKPDLLLLDEPTNHLDLPSIEWIEEYLDNYEGTVVIVSHDRFFLDRVVNKIAEISNSKITTYTGNYTFYLEAKAMSEELQKNQFKNQEKYIKEQEKFIDRFRAKASKAKAVQSRIKALERVEKINDVEDPAATININFNFNTQPGKVIASLDVKSKKYKDLEIFHNTQIRIDRGDKIALIGANGKGKSTLLRMIDGSEPFDGKFEDGHNVIKAFYAQHQLESLNLEHDLLDELRDCAPDQSDTTLRTLLGAFLFSGDDVFKKIRVLSGGEKSRVALAKTILTKANFMLLDEPTNHLDIQSVNILIQVLNKFKGSYVIVSHDRFFLAEVANKIWYIENKQLKEYPGTYAEYEEWQERQLLKKTTAPVKAKVAEQEAVKPKENGAQKQADNEKQKEKKKQHLKISSTVKSLEQQLEQLKKEKDSLIVDMADPLVYSDPEKNKKLQHQFRMNEIELAKKQEEWELAFSQMIELEG